MLCAIAEHGLVPSVVATRMTYAAAPEAFHGAVAAGLLGCGSVVLGSAEVAGKFYAQRASQMPMSPATTAATEIAAKIFRHCGPSKKAIPGFGHPQHSRRRPARATCLLALAKEHGMEGKTYRHAAHDPRQSLPEAIGRPLPINVNGAIPAVMLDAGFPLAALKGISLLRAPRA